MKQRHFLAILALLLFSLAACSPGHTGDTLIAFLRAGQLWSIDPDGANASGLVTQGSPVVGFNWSPDHRLLAFRQLDTTFASNGASKRLFPQAVTEQVGDVPSTLNTFGVDGGTPITIALSSPSVRYSNPFWINNGTRLLYRQTGLAAQTSPEEATWWVAQSDQPAGIAAKALPPLLSLPSVDEHNQSIAGSSEEGILSNTLQVTRQRYLLHTPLSGHPLSATLERVLWQPGQTQSLLLFASRQSGLQGAPATLQLQLLTTKGTATPLLSCACEQFAWSPDGASILYQEGSQFTIFSLRNQKRSTIQAESSSVPYWSPDSRFLLLDGLNTLQLIQPGTQQQQVLLRRTHATDEGAASLQPTTNALLQPPPNSPWASDSQHLLFQTRGRLLLANGQVLKRGEGLYTVGIMNNGTLQDQPAQIASGNVSQAGWTYQNPNTSFLYE